MSWKVYILKSLKDGDYYKGITENIERRLEEHNTGQSKFTATKMPWRLVYLMIFNTKREALTEERRVKKLNRLSIEKLIQKSPELSRSSHS